MKILVCKVFGIGNCVMAVPMIKALKLLYPDSHLDVLIGRTDDDGGAGYVFSDKKYLGINNILHEGAVELQRNVYDVAILAIPYDGRWRNGAHFFARKVLDGRPRPGQSSTLGFSSWQKHEIEYQMDNARELGYKGQTPDTQFRSYDSAVYSGPKRVYIGIGYKKDARGLWSVKHWGNENYAALIKLMLDEDPELEVVMTGDGKDLVMSMAPIRKMVKSPSRFKFQLLDLESSVGLLKTCSVYVGNDTGMMHVAVANGISTVGLFFMENAIVKNRPVGKSVILDATQSKFSVEDVFRAYKEITNG